MVTPFATPLASNHLIPLDELFDAALSEEDALDGLIRPGVGLFLLTLTALDLFGNIVGLPILTGTIAAAFEAPVSPVGIAFLVAVQIAVLATAIHTFAQTPWKLWIGDELAAARGRDGGVRISDLPVLAAAGRLWERLVGAPAAAPVDHGRGGLVVFGVLLVAAIGAIALAFPPGLPIAILAGLIMVGRPLLRVLHALLRRAISDRSSMTGLILGVFASLGLILLIANPMGVVGTHFHRSWTDPQAAWFRTVEMFLFATILVWVLLLPGARLNTDVVAHVGRPREPHRTYFDLGSFQTLTGRRVVVQFDRSLVVDLVVLVHRPDRSYVAVDPAAPLDLRSQRYLVLNLMGLRNSVTTGGTVPLHDARGMFRPTVQLSAAPRALSPADLPIHFPPRSIDALIGLLASSDIAGELRRLAQDAYDDFASRVSQFGADLDVRFRQLEGEVDAIPLELTSGADMHGNLFTLDSVRLEAGLSEQEQKEAALMRVKSCQQQGASLAEHWMNAMKMQLTAAPGVRTAFHSRFGAVYTGNDQSAQILAHQFGLDARASLTPESGGPPRGDLMLASLNDRCREVRQLVLEDLKQSRERNTKLVVDLLKLRDDRDANGIKMLMQMLPEFLPYFRNRQEMLLKFLEYVASNNRGSSPSPDRVRELLASFHAPGGPVGSGRP